MKKDIEIPEVQDIHVAATLETNPDGNKGWYVYIINNKESMIEGVMVTSKGYGTKESGEQVSTSVMRHAIGNLPAKTAAKIEPITEEVFVLDNEYWVTFFENNRVMEKKFVFGAYTIEENLLENVPVMNKKGIIVL